MARGRQTQPKKKAHRRALAATGRRRQRRRGDVVPAAELRQEDMYNVGDRVGVLPNYHRCENRPGAVDGIVSQVKAGSSVRATRYDVILTQHDLDQSMLL